MMCCTGRVTTFCACYATSLLSTKHICNSLQLSLPLSSTRMNMQQQLQLLAAELQQRIGASAMIESSGLGPARVDARKTLRGQSFKTSNSRANNNSVLTLATSETNSNSQLFLYVLHALLDDAERSGHSGIISWCPNETSFQVKNQRLLASSILPAYFPHLQGPLSFTKFQIQLKDLGFDQLENGVFLHPYFQRSNAPLCRYMKNLQEVNETKDHSAVRSLSLAPASSPNIDLYSCLLQQLQGHSSHALQLSALLQGTATSSNQQSTDALNALLLGQLLEQTQPSHRKIHQTTNPRPAFAAGPGLPSRAVPLSSGIVPHGRSVALLAQSQHISDPSVTAKLSAPINEVPAKQSRNQVNNVDDKSSVAAKPPAYTKRAAFLNKRSLASGTTYRATSKKQKVSAASKIPASLEQSNHWSNSIRASQDKDAFVLNQEFHPGDLPDLLFPWNLHDVLDDAEQDESIKSAICWNEDAASFSINDETKFSNVVMTKYFEENDWESFCLSLSNWGFVRFTSGAQKGSYVHRLLVKGKRSLCKQMRIRGKSVSELSRNQSQFLGRLHALLQFADRMEKQSIVSWTKEGKEFTIHDPSEFMNSIFTEYFDSMTHGSLEQKLKRFGFSRNPAKLLNVNKDAKLSNVTYSHPCFQRNKVPSIWWVSSSMKELSTIRPEHNFLVRLRILLNDSTQDGNQLIISWLPHGKGFAIHDRFRFADHILPKYFKGKFTSFRQALRNHGFAQMGGSSWDEGAHYHKFFTRDEPLLCQGLTQEQMKKAMPDFVSSADEPNFYLDGEEQDASLLDAANSIVLLKNSPST